VPVCSNLQIVKSPLISFLCIAIIGFGTLRAQSSPTPFASTTPIVAQPPSPPPEDIQYLKGQLTEIHSLHDSLISTAQWALGVALALTALLVGYNWFTTSRNLERDRQALRQELVGTLQTSIAELREKIGAEISSASTSSAKRLKEEINSTLKGIETDVKKVEANADERNAEIEYALTIHEALLWKLRGVSSNEFTQYIRLLELAIPRKSASEIDTALRELLRLMEVHLIYSSSTVTHLTDLLERLPSQYASQVGVLREALQKKLKSDPPM